MILCFVLLWCQAMYVHVHCLTTSFSNEKLAHIHLVRRPAGTIRSGTDAVQAE